MRQYDLFDEQVSESEETYEQFVKKFEAKKTTDDCYTPPHVYDVVLSYVRQNYDIIGKEVVRPFYPGGDYLSFRYDCNTVVVDNPPFSIITQICRHYIREGIPFFLFAPHLTLFTADMDCTHIVTGADIRYENGAIVKTSFLSNMFGDAKVIGDHELLQQIEDVQEANRERKELPKYVYPPNVLTVSHVAAIVERGISIRIDKNSTSHCRYLDCQKRQGKVIFGSGFLISEKAAAEKAAAEKAAAEKAAAIVWQLSDREQKIIDRLGDDCFAYEEANLFSELQITSD
jgi:hypothetical protein